MAPTLSADGHELPSTSESPYALHNLFMLVPYMPVDANGAIDYGAADPALLVQVAHTAEVVVLMSHMSITAIGQILSRLTLFATDDEVGTDAIEVLGALLSELGDLAAVAVHVSRKCRNETYDYAPDVVENILLVRP